MVDKLPNSKNDSYNKRDSTGNGDGKKDSAIDSVRKDIQNKVDKILRK